MPFNVFGYCYAFFVFVFFNPQHARTPVLLLATSTILLVVVAPRTATVHTLYICQYLRCFFCISNKTIYKIHFAFKARTLYESWQWICHLCTACWPSERAKEQHHQPLVRLKYKWDTLASIWKYTNGYIVYQLISLQMFFVCVVCMHHPVLGACEFCLLMRTHDESNNKMYSLVAIFASSLFFFLLSAVFSFVQPVCGHPSCRQLFHMDLFGTTVGAAHTKKKNKHQWRAKERERTNKSFAATHKYSIFNNSAHIFISILLQSTQCRQVLHLNSRLLNSVCR